MQSAQRTPPHPSCERRSRRDPLRPPVPVRQLRPRRLRARFIAGPPSLSTSRSDDASHRGLRIATWKPRSLRCRSHRRGRGVRLVAPGLKEIDDDPADGSAAANASAAATKPAIESLWAPAASVLTSRPVRKGIGAAAQAAASCDIRPRRAGRASSAARAGAHRPRALPPARARGSRRCRRACICTASPARGA